MGAEARFALSGFLGDHTPRALRRILSGISCAEEVDLERADFVICSVFDDAYLFNSDAVRIFFTTENILADFNLVDYSFGFSHISFGDRHLRYPNYLLYPEFSELLAWKPVIPTPSFAERQFCNFIYSNGRAHPFRDALFAALGEYRFVHSPGKHLNNCDRIDAPYLGDWSHAKVAYQARFKFSVAVENSSSPGYTTEKIVHALAANTIPIYWGDPLVAQEFNPRRFVNCHDFPSVAAVIEEVKRLDQDQEAYLSMLAEPPFAETATNLDPSIAQARLREILERPKADAFRRSRHALSAKYETARVADAERRRASDTPSGRGQATGPMFDRLLRLIGRGRA